MMAILVFNELAIKDDPLKVHSEPCQTSKMERFAKIVNGENSKYFRKRSMLDVCRILKTPLTQMHAMVLEKD